MEVTQVRGGNTKLASFGVLYGGAGTWSSPPGATVLPVEAESAGFDSVWAVDHVIVSEGVEQDYREQGGSWELSPSYPIADPMVWLAHAAAVTSRIKLGTGVLVAPIRPAAVLANQAASVDVLSGGRLLLGLGAGWIEDEIEACGVQFSGRVKVLEESVEAMRALWRGPRASFAGHTVKLENMTLAPRPAAGSVPVILGGRVPAAARRAGRIANGFFPHTPDREQLSTLFRIARDAAEEAGRDPDQMEWIAGGAKTADDVDALVSLGANHIVFSPRIHDVAGLKEKLLQIMSDVIRPSEAFRRREQ